MSEFILVDTGSTDNTIEIAQSRGVKVSQTVWNDDFAQARNISRNQATQPWILRIDPDERISPKDFSSLIELTRADVVAYQLPARSYIDDPNLFKQADVFPCRNEYPEMEKTYCGFQLSFTVRLFRNLPEIQYVGKIHESVVSTLPSGMKALELRTVPIHHYGCLASVADEKKKQDAYSKLLRHELKINPHNWHAEFELGMHYIREANYLEASKAFLRALKYRPHKPQILSNLGFCFLNLHFIAEAERVLKTCIAKDPSWVEAWINLAACEIERGNLMQALAFLNRSLELNPQSHIALRVRAHCHARMGSFVEAEKDLRKAVNILPGFAEAKTDLAHLLKEMEQSLLAQQVSNEVSQARLTHNQARMLDITLLSS